ncbi:hypothetical protein [Algicella marina]|uniref:Uncharacterized protein n=1 Tax=Algicella marina TaxID=2683284 RepID=A0A6P1SWS0_9RHOB|nr:hypothetical protein [Algicella marina]QHQ34888.1 hypothetical protein GO499_06570 [Algicella marina]
MAIKSHAFGRVTLTKDDAAKFARQVTYGRAKDVAKTTVERGSAMNEEFQSEGKVTFKLRRRAKKLVAS